ncbi:MAG TPA: 3,4-dihydroxy-2-butanone-4-phosphate synthase [Phycisphaerales bacterium]|nr:3,4-dihydroxy-2-butanone-4-phosphate synthase [Phycisphaerales bacterium]
MFSPIPEILEELKAGRMVVLTDDENRENEGDLIIPAQFVTPEAITFMLQNALGYMCLSLTEADCDRLNLHPQSAVNTTVRGTPFTVSIDLHPKHGGTTGVSAKERAKCILMAIDPRYDAEDFVRPGHINPLRSRDGGVLVRTGQTEGSLDLCRLAGLYPAAVIIEIMKPDGEMARVPDLAQFCQKHNLKMCSVAQIIEWRLERESLVRRVQPFEGRPLKTAYGTFNTLLFQSVVDPLPHLVLTCGGVGKPAPGTNAAPRSDKPTLVRMHRRHLLGDVFGDLEGGDVPSGDTLRASMQAIQAEGHGAIVYLRTNNPADEAGSVEAILQSLARPGDPNVPTFSGPSGSTAHPHLLREYGVGGQILRNLGLSRLRLLTNSNTELPGLEAFGLEITERVPVHVPAR